MDQGRLEEHGSPNALSQRPRALLRPTRFDPPVLVQSSGGRDVRDQHAEQLAAAMSVAREDGLRKARTEVDATIARYDAAQRGLLSVTRALLQAVDQLQAHDGEAIERVQHQAVMFGAALAEELIGRELRMSDDVVTATVDRAIAFAPDRGGIILRVHPSDLAVAREHAEGIDQIAGRVDLVGDPAIEPGGCVATVGPLRIDAQVGVALERVRAVLAS